MRIASFCLAFSAATAWLQVPPGALQAMNTGSLQQLITARPGFPALPASAGATTVVTCAYAPARAGVPPVLRHFWYQAAPPWLAAVPASHPVHPLVPASAAACPPTVAPPSPEAPSSFLTKGLENEQTLTRIFHGDFARIELTRESALFGTLFAAYLNAYGQQCDGFLPANKVEMTRSVCAREQYTVNGYGNRVRGSTCIEYRQVGTGIFADPVLYAAKRERERAAAPDSLRDAFQMVTRPDAIGAALNLAGEAKTLQNDLQELVRKNGCANPAWKRFETNLMAYALAKPGVKSQNLAEPNPTPRPEGPFRDSNYTRLLDDLVAEQSKSWAMNRYEPGSIAALNVASRDTAGRPSRITARYVFRGFNGRSQGGVTLEFIDGQPECLYFFDFPTTCRKASRRIDSAYAEGAYR